MLRLFRMRLFLIAAAVICAAHAMAATEPAPADDPNVQILTRGPIHEAFAGTVVFDPEPGLVIKKTPPERIEELPPKQKPVGEHVAWIPGYWGWDDDRNDFLWISGVWRALPPGRQWTPGYWREAQGGYQWVSGYWSAADQTEVEYLPEPPASVEAGPNVAAASNNETWIPGCWVWTDGRYAWQAGTWTAAQTNWDWIPAHYVWAPRGYLFVNGYWDYGIARRGVLFAPVAFANGALNRTGFAFSPTTAINLAVFGEHLFLRPNYGHYYFGDYYGSNYRSNGYYPWFSFNANHLGYDPFFAHQTWQHRDDRNWSHGITTNFQNRMDHENARPPRTFAAQQALGVRTGNGMLMAQTFGDLSKQADNPLRLQPVDPSDHKSLIERGQALHQFRQDRQQLENSATSSVLSDRSVTGTPPFRAKVSASPYVARGAAELGAEHTPPQRHEVLKPNLGIEAKPRGEFNMPRTQAVQPNQLEGRALQAPVGPPNVNLGPARTESTGTGKR